MNRNPSHIYQERIKLAAGAARNWKKRLDLLVLFRVLFFLGGATVVYFLFKISTASGLSGIAGFLIIFLFLVRWHAGVKYKYDLAKMKVEVGEEELKALDGDYSAFSNGSQYTEQDHAFALDLDLFGPNNVFQSMNRTATYNGEKNLVQRLLSPSKDPENLKWQQEAVKELTGMDAFREKIRALGKLSGKKGEEEEKLLEYLGEEQEDRLNGPFKWVIYGISLISLALFFSALLGAIGWNRYLLFLVVPFGLLAWKGREAGSRFKLVAQYLSTIKAHSGILQQVEDTSFNSAGLQEVQKRIIREGERASQKVAQLERIVNAFESRSNPFVGLVMNALFLWDLQCLKSLQGFLRQNREDMVQWFEVVGEVDALSSLATYAFQHPNEVFPEVSMDGPVMEAKDLGHPLLAEKERVTNDLAMNDLGQFKIITGANMAGKSTFLRSVGVAYVLGLAGTVVCASEMKFQPLYLFTSMRTSDSLTSHESYFFSELKRLHMIVEQLEKEVPCFILLDEILKGTNSDDKKAGSKAFLKKLLTFPVSGIVATHDLDLTAMGEHYPDKIENLRFEVEITEEGLDFDYLLRPGVCKNMNATYLMERMGIIGK